MPDTSTRRLAHQPASHLSGGTPHVVQFYETDGFLCNAVADFLADGLMVGQPVVAIATASHAQGIAAHLRAKGIDVDHARASGQLTVLDARDTMSMFMTEADPDPARFRDVVGGVIQRALRGRSYTTVRAYGEMVDVLWREGRADAALKLEGLWNKLACTHSFSLLCAYSMENFVQETQGLPFEEICRHHSHVIPAESYTQAADDPARSREISRLQQRAQALEAEIAHRKQLEQALRDALAERQSAERERERLLVAERQARNDAEEAGRLKDEFLAVLSHELRTPINAILGWTHLAKLPSTDAPTIERAWSVVQRNAELQSHLINDLLDVSRIVTGKMQIATGRVDLKSIVAMAVDTVRPGATAKEIELVVYADDGCEVIADADRLQQVVWNLLSNALKFTERGGWVTVLLERDDVQARIIVTDTGQGIGTSFLPFVFERFRQEHDGCARPHGGLGVGLAVARSLVEAHGGTLTAESGGEGAGAAFTIELPLAR